MAEGQQNVSHVREERSKNVKRKRSPSDNNRKIFFRVDSSGKERGEERGRSRRGRSSRESDNHRSRREGSQRGGRRPEKDESGANEKQGACQPVKHRGSAREEGVAREVDEDEAKEEEMLQKHLRNSRR